MEHSSFEYVEPSIHFIDQENPIDKIAFVAHNCYKVEPKDHLSNLDFAKRLVQNKHLAMIEHARFTIEASPFLLEDLQHFNNPFIVFDIFNGRLIISYSLRVLIENSGDNDPHVRKVISALGAVLPQECQELVPNHEGWASPYSPRLLSAADIHELPEEIRDRHLWLSYLLRTDRGVTHELVRHRVCSFAQESTRYCNYSKKKFGDRISVIKPLDYLGREDLFDSAFENAAEAYFNLLKVGAIPQQARAVLPTGLKADLVITCNLTEWKHIFELRLAKAAHPECRRILLLVSQDMIDKGLLPTDYNEKMSV